MFEIYNYIKIKFTCRCTSINMYPNLVNTFIKNYKDFGFFSCPPLYKTFIFIVCVCSIVKLNSLYYPCLLHFLVYITLLPRPYYYHVTSDSILESCTGTTHPMLLVKTRRCTIE